MKKMVGSLLMTSALLLGSIAPVVANAADTSTGSTTTSAGFTKKTDTVGPVDPDKPTNPIDPGDGNGTGGNDGSGLILVYAPKTIGFGTHVLDPINDESYGADGATIGDSSNVNSTPVTATDTNNTSGTNILGASGNVALEVQDTRGANTGWTLSVASSALTAKKNSSTTLAGATITFPKGATTSTGATSNNATSSAISGLTTDNTSATILGAETGDGEGVTISQMAPKDITLNVLANTATEDTYSGTLTWTLTDAALK